MKIDTIREIKICEAAVFGLKEERKLIQRIRKGSTGRAKAKLDKLLYTIEQDIQKMKGRREMIIQAFDQIEDAATKEMIRLYLSGYTWNQISRKMYYSSESSCRKRVVRALEKIDFDSITKEK